MYPVAAAAFVAVVLVGGAAASVAGLRRRVTHFVPPADEWDGDWDWPDAPPELRSPAGEALHRFTFPAIPGWVPASVEDALALGCDLAMYGDAFATVDGRRVDPETIVVADGVAYGGKVRLP